MKKESALNVHNLRYDMLPGILIGILVTSNNIVNLLILSIEF